MPSCFYSEPLSQFRNHLSRVYKKLPHLKNADPHYYGFVSQKSTFVFPRFRREDRRHSYINAVSYFFLSGILADHYPSLRKLNKRSALSIAPSIFDWQGDRALIRPLFDVRDAEIANLNARFQFVAEADVHAFYHSIYTHVIPWAIHGKPVAKKDRSSSLLGNIIDRLVRNAQDGQTIGLPVGPDTSRLIAETVGTAIDASIQSALRSKRKFASTQRTGARFVDDYMIGCDSDAEARSIISTIRKCSNEFELELNGGKSKVTTTGTFYAADWREYIRTELPSPPFDKTGLSRFFYVVSTTASNHPESNVKKFAIQVARGCFFETEEWRVCEDYLLSAYREEPTLVSLVAEIVILRHVARKDVSVERVRAFVGTQLPILIDQQRFGEVCWLLFMSNCLGATIKAKAVSGLFEVEDSCCAILLCDASKRDIISGKIDRAVWNESLTPDGLRGSMWLYSYEGTLKAMTGVSKSTHVTSDPYFGPMAKKKIEFYRSGADHLEAGSVLARLHMLRMLRIRREEAIGADLGGSLEDFESDDYDDDYSDVY